MRERALGWLLAVAILGGVVLILVFNLNLKPRATAPPSEPRSPRAVAGPPAGFREYPIGDQVERNQMRIGAVWLPPIQMEGMDTAMSSSLIHLEADVKATEGNRNGFAEDEKIPYLVVHYRIEPVDAAAKGALSKAIEADLTPMVAKDGLHYGASIDMPKPGRFKLTYRFEPPSAGGLGRHSDAATGVDPWWKPFEVSFDWDYPGPPSAGTDEKPAT